MSTFHGCHLLALACLFLPFSSLLSGCNVEPDVVAISIEVSGNIESRRIAGQREPGIERSVRVGEFIDSRRDRTILGAKSGRWGALDSCIFTVKEGDLGAATARALSRYLKTTGWQIRTIDDGRTSPKLLVSGEIIEMQVNASSNLFTTHVTTSVILLLEEADHKTNKRSAVRLNGSGSTNVLWFDADDAESLLRKALTDAFRQWLPSTDTDVNRPVMGAHLESD